MAVDNNAYFYRTVVFSRQNQRIALVDIEDPEQRTPLDDWMGIVISLADGAHTINELITYLHTRYPQPPHNLTKTLQSVIERLLEGNLLALSKTSVALPYYLSAPIEQLDLDKACEQLRQDGHLN